MPARAMQIPPMDDSFHNESHASQTTENTYCHGAGGPPLDCAQRFTNLEVRMDGVEKRLDGVEKRLDGVEKRLDGVEKRLDKVEVRLDGIEQRLDGIDSRLLSIEERLYNVVYWIIGTMIVGIGIAIGACAWQATWFQNSINANQAANRALIEEMDKRWQAINAEQQKRFEDNMRELRSLHAK